MDDRQNAMEIIRFGKPERVMSALPAREVGYLGANQQGYGDTGMSDGHQRPAGSRWLDIWGTGWVKDHPEAMGFPCHFPLTEPALLRDYVWPDPDDERVYGPIYQAAGQRDPRDGPWLSGSHRSTLWERAYMLAGMENMMAFFFTEPAFAREVLGRIMDFQCGVARHYARAGVETASLGDDLGTQISLLVGMDIFHGFLEPEYRRLFDFYKRRNIIVSFHSCGHVEPLLESFIGLGVDVLNPVQATANSLDRVIAVTRGRMALLGGVSTQLLMDGPTEAIRRGVRETIGLLGRDGGYFCAPDQGMPFPPDHWKAFGEAVAEYGKY